MVMASPARARKPRRRKPATPRIRPWTRADLARLPDDGNRYEVLDGQLLVTPQASRAHQYLTTDFTVALERYLRPMGVAHVVGPGSVPFGPDELQPDVMVIPGPRRPGNWDDGPVPILVVEVLSRSSRRYDLGAKLDAYANRVGVPTVWIVDHWERHVHVCERGSAPRVERLTLIWQAPGAPERLTIELPEFFRTALGE